MPYLRRLLGVLAMLSSMSASAENLWDGKWYAVPDKTHLSAHSFTLEKLGNGMWRYDSGDAIYILDPSGAPFPEPLQPRQSVITREISNRTIRFEEWVNGKPVLALTKSLSADGQQLAATTAYFDGEGKQRGVRQLMDVRVGTGRGLEGRWRELPQVSAAGTAKPPAQKPAKPFWVISSDAEGVMTWTIPASGEVLKGVPDGKQYASAGPGQPEGRTFKWDKLSPRHLMFYGYDRGHLVEEVSEELSTDGKRWTEWLWNPVYPEERDLRAYERR